MAVLPYNLGLMALRILLILPVIICAALAKPLLASVGESPSRVSLRDGSVIKDFAWWDEDDLLLYAVNPHGAILWKHNLPSGSREKLITATGLAELLRINGGWDKVSFDLSPGRGYISFHAPPPGPLEPALFRVAQLSPGKVLPLEFHKFPTGFIVGKHSWDNTDRYIYLSDGDYSPPSNSISLGRLSLETGAFLALAVKDQVDLINELDYGTFSNSLLITSRSYSGEYPRSEFLLEYSLNNNTLSKVTEAYMFRGIQAVASGDILAAVIAQEAFKEGALPGFLMVDNSFRLPNEPAEGRGARLASRILLIPTEGETTALLDSQDRGFDFEPSLSPDGRFIAFKRMYYRLPMAVAVSMPENEIFLCLRKRDSLQEYLVARNADSYRFSPGARYIAARSSNQDYLEVFELPRG